MKAKEVAKKKMSMDDLKEIVEAYKVATHTATTLSCSFNEEGGWSASCINRVRRVDRFDGKVILLCKLIPDKWLRCSIRDCKM